jgi:hypothetical protein
VYTFGEYAARNLQGAGALKWERMPEQYQHGQQHKNYCCNAAKTYILLKYVEHILKLPHWAVLIIK